MAMARWEFVMEPLERKRDVARMQAADPIGKRGPRV